MGEFSIFYWRERLDIRMPISRTDSSVKTLIEQGINLEKLSYLFADWNRGQAENRMNQIISQYGTEVEMVISNNDEMALGAIEAYKDAGL